MKKRFANAMIVLLLTLACLMGCGKAETASSTDTAVTETVAPESVASPPGTEAEESATAETAPESQAKEAPSSSTESADSGEN